MKKLLTAVSLSLFSVSALAAINVPKHDIEAGKTIAENNCAACHGVNGVSVVPSQPNLGGQHIKYLYKQLLDFKSGHRVNGIMQAQVANLSQQDLANVSAFYASQQPWGVSYGNPATADQAMKLYLGGDKSRGVIPCAGCHDPKGQGNAWAGFPRLGGQHSAYVATQLKLFRAAGREDDVSKDQMRVNDAAKEGEKGMMQMVAKHLSDKDIAMLSDLIAGLH